MNRILFVSFSGPYPSKDGKRQRTWAILQALNKRYEVDFLIIGHQEDFNQANQSCTTDRIRFFFLPFERTRYEQFLHRIGFVFITSTFLSDQITSLCEKKKYKFVFSRYIHPTLFLPGSLPIVADIDDDWEESYRSKLAQATSTYQKFRLRQVLLLNSGIYKRLIKKLNLGFLVKPEPKWGQLRLLPNLPFQLLQQGNFSFSPSFGTRLLFVGKLTYGPNLSGIKWFIREVYPMILSILPQVSLSIVSNLKVKDSELERFITQFPSIQVQHNVDDLVEVYKTHSISIAPILEGAGSNIKIAESLWMGRPVVTTPFGMRGYESEGSFSFLVACSSPESFGLRILDWFKNSEKLGKDQFDAYHFGQEKYNLEDWSETLLNELAHVC